MKKFCIFFWGIFFLCLLCCCKESCIDRFVRTNGFNLNEEKNDCAALVNAGTILKAKEVMINNIKYAIAYDENRPVYIETHDENFLTAEGLSINSTIAECLMKGIVVEAEPGVGLFMKLKNGWRVYLSSGDEALHLSDKVRYFCIIDDKLSRSVDLKTWVDYTQTLMLPDHEEEHPDNKVFFVPIP